MLHPGRLRSTSMYRPPSRSCSVQSRFDRSSLQRLQSHANVRSASLRSEHLRSQSTPARAMATCGRHTPRLDHCGAQSTECLPLAELSSDLWYHTRAPCSYSFGSSECSGGDATGSQLQYGFDVNGALAGFFGGYASRSTAFRLFKSPSG